MPVKVKFLKRRTISLAHPNPNGDKYYRQGDEEMIAKHATSEELDDYAARGVLDVQAVRAKKTKPGQEGDVQP